MIIENKDCAVIVSSCDAFDDVWRPFFTLFFTYWPDCPFPIYLITNFKTYPDSRVTTLAVGEDKSWAENTRKALSQIPEGHIIWLLEDLLLEKPTNTGYLLKLLEYVKNQHAATVRLYPTPPPNQDFVNDLNLGQVSTDADYRASLIAGIWNKEIFLSLLKDGENPWQMEMNGTERSRELTQPFYSVKAPALHYHERTGVIRGKWMYPAVKLCKKHGITLDLKRRPIDYRVELRSRLDILRKQSIGRAVRRIPIIGTIASKILYTIIAASRTPHRKA